MDGILQVLSPDGFVLEQNNDFYDFDPHVVCTAPADGDYVVRIFAFPQVPDSSIRFTGGPKFLYRLTLTTGPFADHAYPPAAARSAPGADLVGWNLTDKLRRLPLTPGDDDVALVHHPDLANTVSVQLQANPVLVGPQQLVLPATVCGKIERRASADVYPFEAKKGQKLSFRVEARSLGFPLDAVLRVVDGAGKEIGAAQPKKLNSDPTLDITCAEDGMYRLEVRDVYEEGGPRHVYLLHAGPPAPDFALKVAADRFTRTPGKPLDIPVTVERRGGHSGDIELTVEGLPPGLTATPQPGKTSLRLEGEAKAFAGPIRIVGRAAGLPPRSARATIAELNSATPQLWLTAGAP
jgi:hypothetical protein